jgi:UMF1 family MFS transporter
MVAHTGDARSPGVAPSTRHERVGWYFYDWANSAFATTVITVFVGPYLGSIAEDAADVHGHVYALSVPIAAGSFYAYTVAVSVIVQVFVLPLVGAIADRSARKKQWLAIFAYLGASATVGLGFLTEGRYLLGGILLIAANVAFGSSIVVYNSFLPQIASPDQRDGVSSIGWAMGYIGGGLLLAINMAAVLFKDTLAMTTAEVARWSIVSAAMWWAIFTMLPLRRLRNRPPVAGQARGRALTDGFRQLSRTIRGLKGYPLTLLFLAALLIYGDGIQTVVTMTSVYATNQLGLPDTVLVPTILMVQLLAFVGALTMGALAGRIGAQRTLLASLVVWACALLAAFFLPHGQPAPFVALAAVIGCVLGGSQALSRSLFSHLIPHGKEAEYFGISEFSDRGTSWVGPLLFGLTYQHTGSYRLAIVSLLVFFVAGFVVVAVVPMRRAIVAAGNEPPQVV